MIGINSFYASGHFMYDLWILKILGCAKLVYFSVVFVVLTCKIKEQANWIESMTHNELSSSTNYESYNNAEITDCDPK